MKISQKCRYALAVILDLSNYYMHGLVHISDLAQRRNIPQKYLSQVMLELKKGNLVKSKKGPNGGYSLVKPPDHIMVGDVIRLADRSWLSTGCINNKDISDKKEANRDGFFGVLDQVEDAVCSVINNISFSEIQKRETALLSLENSGDTYYI
jgi:Rrf2 family protein